MSKPKIKMSCTQGLWTVSTEFYNVHMVCIARSISEALRGLQSDMRYVEYNLAVRLWRKEAS